MQTLNIDELPRTEKRKKNKINEVPPASGSTVGQLRATVAWRYSSGNSVIFFIYTHVTCLGAWFQQCLSQVLLPSKNVLNLFKII